MFSLVSLYITAVCNTPLIINITAYNSGNAVCSIILFLNDPQPIYFVPHWRDIDTVTFSAYLLNGAPFQSSEVTFAIDNLLVEIDQAGGSVRSLEREEKKRGQVLHLLSSKLEKLEGELNKLKKDNAELRKLIQKRK